MTKFANLTAYLKALNLADKTVDPVARYARVDHVHRAWIKHDGSEVCPVIPGTLIRFRHRDRTALTGALLRSGNPEALDWQDVVEWRPEWTPEINYPLVAPPRLARNRRER